MVVLIPLAAVVVKSTEANFWSVVTSPRAIAALELTVGISLVVAAINAGVPGANIALPEGRNPDRPPDYYLDTTRLRDDTGFRPEYDVERAVPDYVDWLRGHDR